MQRRQPTRRDIEYLRLQAFTYVFASLFMFFNLGIIPYILGLIIGIIFAAITALYLLAPFWRVIFDVAERFNGVFSLGVYIATVALLIQEVLKSPISLAKVIGVLVFLIILVTQDIISIFWDIQGRQQNVPLRVIVATRLRQLGFVVSFFTLLLLAFNITGMGNPLLWLASSIVLVALGSII